MKVVHTAIFAKIWKANLIIVATTIITKFGIERLDNDIVNVHLLSLFIFITIKRMNLVKRGAYFF